MLLPSHEAYYYYYYFCLLCCPFSICSVLKAGNPESGLVPSPLSIPYGFPQVPRGATAEGRARRPGPGLTGREQGGRLSLGSGRGPEPSWFLTAHRPAPRGCRSPSPRVRPGKPGVAAVAKQEANRGPWAALTGRGGKERGSLRLGASPLRLGDLESETPAPA